MKTAQNDSDRQLQSLRETRTNMLARLAVEVRLLRKFEKRFETTKSRDDRRSRDNFAKLVDATLSEISRISYQVDAAGQEVSHE